MKSLVLSLFVVVAATSTATAYVGDQWVLGIHHFNLSGHYSPDGFTEHVGDGWDGPYSSGNSAYFGNAYSHYSNPAFSEPYEGDITRVYWDLSGNSVNGNNPVPSTTELYQIEYFGVPQPGGRNDYQPIESQFHGSGGEEYPIDPHIPWPGQFGTNHQWVKLVSQSVDHINGEWLLTGPGPQVDNRAPADGTMMWLTAGSWLYAKWDFLSEFGLGRSWSALRLTQITGEEAPEDGDFNGDGNVDALDYVVWRTTEIDGEDGYNRWRSTYGGSPGTGTTVNSVVPEPTAASALLLSLVCYVIGIRRRG